MGYFQSRYDPTVSGATEEIRDQMDQAILKLKSKQPAQLAAYRARQASNPRCTAVIRSQRGERICGHRLTQNKVEHEDGTWWCGACGRYTDGTAGFPVGHPGAR